MNPRKISVSTKIFSCNCFQHNNKKWLFLNKKLPFLSAYWKVLVLKFQLCHYRNNSHFKKYWSREWLLIVSIFHNIIVWLYFVSKKCRLREHKTLLSKTLLHITDPKLCVMCFSCPRERHVRAGGRKWGSACSGSDFKKKEHAHYSHCQTGSWTGQRW